MPSTATSILDGLSTSVAVKAPVRAVATSNITLSGLQTVGGVALAENDRVLVTAQTTGSLNGIYSASTGSWTRTKDFDGNRDVVQFTIIPIDFTVGNGAFYQVTTANPIVIGTTSIGFSIHDPNITYVRTDAEIAAGVTPANFSIEPYHVARYGAVGDGVTDDTAAIQRAISSARAAGGRKSIQLGDGKTYLITSALVLASDSLGAVDVVGAAPEWFGGSERSVVKGSFDGPLFNASGTLATYSPGPVISNVVLENLNTGTSACLVRADYSGGVRMSNVLGKAANYGVYATAEMISPEFHEVCIYRPSSLYLVSCYKVHCRNAKWVGGRAYSGQYALDITGDTPTFFGLNVEFSQVAVRHGPITGALFVGCHFETSQVLLTNAATVPVDTSGAAYVDNASTGSGITGAVKFLGCTVSFPGSQSNLVTIKTEGGFGYRLEFDSCRISHTNPIVGNSFVPGTSVALPSGTKIVVRNTQGLTIVKPPRDAFSGFIYENIGSQGYIDTSELKLNSDTLLTYTPTWSASGVNPSLGNGSITGHYMKAGNMYLVKVKLTMGSTTTFGAGGYVFSLPAVATHTMTNTARAVDTGTGVAYGFCNVTGSEVVAFTAAGASYSPTVPHTWASTDELEITVAYFA
jgi:hypothetical protein